MMQISTSSSSTSQNAPLKTLESVEEADDGFLEPSVGDSDELGDWEVSEALCRGDWGARGAACGGGDWEMSTAVGGGAPRDMESFLRAPLLVDETSSSSSSASQYPGGVEAPPVTTYKEELQCRPPLSLLSGGRKRRRSGTNPNGGAGPAAADTASVKLLLQRPPSGTRRNLFDDGGETVAGLGVNQMRSLNNFHSSPGVGGGGLSKHRSEGAAVAPPPAPPLVTPVLRHSKRMRPAPRDFSSSSTAALVDSGGEVEGGPCRRLVRCQSEAVVSCALTMSEDRTDLIGDFTRAYCLPLTQSRHQDLKAISSNTVRTITRWSRNNLSHILTGSRNN